MKDDTGRPGIGEKSLPTGTRARNTTTVLDTRRVGTLVGAMERAAPIERVVARREDRVNGLDSIGLEGVEEVHNGPAVGHDDDFQSLDEIFGAMAREQEDLVPQSDSTLSDGVGLASKDASATLLGELGLEDDFQSVLDVFDVPSVASTHVSAPGVVRSTAGGLNTPNQRATTDVFDPFAAMESGEMDSPNGLEDSGPGDDVEFDAATQRLSEPPDVSLGASVGASSPRIVRPGHGGSAHERIILPPSFAASTDPGSDAPEVEEDLSSEQAFDTHEVAPEAEHMTETRDQIFWKSETPLVGFLVTYDHDPRGSYVELRQGRLMVSNQREESGSCLVVVGESVSPMHAIMRVASGGLVQVLDQLSEAGTRVKHLGQEEEEFLSGDKSTLSHGDILFFGDRAFHVLLVVGDVGQN